MTLLLYIIEHLLINLEHITCALACGLFSKNCSEQTIVYTHSYDNGMSHPKTTLVTIT